MSSKEKVRESWIRVMGLPLHLWRQEVLKKISVGCEGFLVIDKEITIRLKVSWARILVKIEGTVRPSVVNILEGTRSFEVQSCWEVPPKTINVYPSKVGKKKNQSQQKREEEREATTRSGKHVWPSTTNLNVEGPMDKMGEEDVRSA